LNDAEMKSKEVSVAKAAKASAKKS